MQKRKPKKDVLKPSDGLTSVLKEKRVFYPPTAFAGKARIKSLSGYKSIYRDSIRHPERFWSKAAESLHWFTRWRKVLRWNPPFAKWFVGGKLNVSYNCLDRHLTTPRKNKAAIIWEGEPGESRTLTYQQ